MLEQKFIGKLNSDDSDRDLKEEVKNCLNLIPQNEGLGTTPRRSNVKGNDSISTITRPEGTNKTIGQYTDKDSQRLVEFLYNSAGNHTIYIYEKTESKEYTVLQTSELNWSEDTKITGAGIIKDQLVFTDTINEIRSIDIKIGKNTFDKNEKREWELYPTTYGGNFQLSVETESLGNPSITVDATTIDTIVTDIEATGYFTAVACGTFIEIKEKFGNNEVKSISADNDYGIAPLNIYPLPITQRQITLINYPAPCSPITEFKTDTTTTANFLIGNSFQFAVRFIYFDDSESTISPYSKMTSKGACGVSSTKKDNYIEVAFNESALTQEELMLIKNVEVLFRNGNSGSFFIASKLDRNEFFGGTYDFYNDGAYDVVPDADVSKQFDSVPNKANALAMLKNRLFVGGYTEGFEPTCVDANLEVDLEEGAPGLGKTWTITGRIRIVSRFLRTGDDGTNIHYNQPIHSLAGTNDRETWVYGGIGGNGAYTGVSVGAHYLTPNGSVDEGNMNKYAQFIPEGGFTVYLAGTNYFDISKQFTKNYQNLDNVSINRDAQTVSDDPIVFNSDGGGVLYKGDTNDENNAFGLTTTRHVMSNGTVVSSFEITGVPPGKYIVRVASPLCAREENLREDTDDFYSLDGNIADWQSTSAQVMHMNDDATSYASNQDRNFLKESAQQELLIDLGDTGGTYDIHQGNGANSILIADLSDPSLLNNSTINEGYLVDPENKTDEDFAASLRMERQRIGVGEDLGTITNTSVITIQTDHNGYFWGGWAGKAVGIAFIRTLAYNGGWKDTTTIPILTDDNENNVYEIKHWNQTHYKDADISDVVNGNLVSGGFSEEKDWANSIDNPFGGTFRTKWIMYNYSSSVRDYGRTVIQGQVKGPDGDPLSDLFTQISNVGRNETTDSEGFYNIVVYADEDETLPDMSRSEAVFIGKGSNACISFTDKLLAFTATPISDGNFNNETPFVLADIVINDLIELTDSVHKRGGVYKWGLVYYDQALRSSFVSTQENLKRRIPARTDDLGVTLPTQYSPGTYRYGKPIITWTINSAPPEWAHYYQWVRTKDTAFSTFLTWSANDVLYVKEWDIDAEDPIETTFGSSEANEIYLDTSNMQTYNNRNTNNNANAKIGYTYTEGDRCILIKNDDEYFETYVDVLIKGTRGDYIIIENLGSLVELKSGLLFQMYTPKLQNETEIYYEIGECYKVLNPETPSRSHEVITGDFIDGDVYVLGRNVTTDIGSVTEFYEHPTIADRVTERFSDIGRPNIVNKNAKTEYFETSVRFSNPFIQNAYDNGISSFNSSNKEDLPLERGPITKMVGTTNVVVAIHKTEATSLYIGEGFLHTADGEALDIKTDKIIGDERVLKGEYGTVNPESVVEFDDVIYWWSQAKGDIIRYSNNGLTPLGLVSKYKNALLEIQKAKESNSQNGINNDVYGGYNPLWDMALMTFKNINGEDVTIGFHERTDSFISRFSFTPELYSYLDQKLYSFKDGEIFEHDLDSVNRNTFYGVTYPSQVHLISNMSNEYEKIYRSLAVKSNEKWAAIRVFNKEGQETSLILNDFVQRDDMYYANLLRNINTSADTLKPTQSPLLHGEVMRSQLMEIVLENTSEDKVELDFVVIDFQESPGHLINKK